MRVEVVEMLRCRRDHEPAWLVAVSEDAVDRDIRSGVLGCPVCSAQYPIADGIADLRAGADAVTPPQPADPDRAIRVAAMLGLEDGTGVVALAGAWGAAAAAVASLAERAHVIAIDPPSGVRATATVSVVLAGGDVPLRPRTARGIALDDAHADAAAMARAIEALGPRGRLVAPAGTAVPAGVGVLARDASWWVAERAAPDVMVELRRPAT